MISKVLISKKNFCRFCFCIFLWLLAACQKEENNFGIDSSPFDSGPQKTTEIFGLVNFGSYSVYIASGNETVEEIANNLGIDYNYFSTYNGMSYFFKPENGTILALPSDYNPEKVIQKSFDVAEAQRTIAQKSEEPKDNESPDSYLTHIVKKDETIFKISRTYDISVKVLSEKNNLKSDFLIYPGQQLKIPIFSEETTVKKEGLSAVANLDDTSITSSPERPILSSNTAMEKEDKEPEKIPQSQDEDQLNLFPPMLGQIVKVFNLSTGGVRNEGLDIQGQEGASVFSAEKGTVMLVSKSAGEKLSVVIIKHSENILTIYAGLNSVDYQKGDKIKKGEKLGTVNEINNILHFEIRKGNKPLNPVNYIDFE